MATPVVTKVGCGSIRASTKTRWRMLSWALVHVLMIAHALHWLRTGRSISPVEPSEAMQTLEQGLINAGFVFLVVAILATLVFGRFLCGWACHLVAYQDLAGWILQKCGLRPKPFRSRLLVFVPFGAAFYMFFWPQLARLLEGREMPPFVLHLTTANFWGTFPSLPISILTVVVCGFLIIVLLGNKGFCTYACPYGALFNRADLVAPGKILVSDACDGCGHCTATCTSNIRVHEEVKLHRRVVDPGCMKCLDCVSVCPKNALRFGFTSKLGFLRGKVARPGRNYDLSWPEEIALALVFFIAMYAFRGLYEAIPFLLTLGLSAMTAFLTLLGWRLVRRPSVFLQGWRLRASGRFTLFGWSYLVGLLALLLFVGHSTVVQYHVHEAQRAVASAARAGETQVMIRQAERAERRYASAIALGLVEPAVWRLGLGSVQAALDRLPEAEQNLRRALELDPNLARAHVSLGDVLLREGREAEATVHLREAERLERDALR